MGESAQTQRRGPLNAERTVTVPFMWLIVAWLLSIVWLPVATAMTLTGVVQRLLGGRR